MTAARTPPAPEPRVDGRPLRTRSRLDALAARLAARANPFLVRHVRQQLRSRAFVGVYVGLLTLSAFVSLLLAQSSTGLDGRAALQLLGVLGAIWSAAVWLYEPVSVFRALSGERDGQTWDLIRLTGQRPRDVVLGLFQASIAQNLLYGSAIVPFAFLAWLLRGVDLVTIALMALFIPAVGLAGSAGALLAASLGRTRVARGGLGVMFALGCAGTWLMFLPAWLTMSSGYSELAYAASMARDELLVVAGGILNASLAQIAVALVLAASMLAPPSANRTTGPRLAFLGAWVNLAAWIGVASAHDGRLDEGLSIIATAGAWTACLIGYYGVTEDDGLTPRQARSFLEGGALRRLAGTVLGPGSAAGRLAFLATILLAGLAGAAALVAGFDPRDADELFGVTALPVAYMAIWLIVARVTHRGVVARRMPGTPGRRAWALVLLVGFTMLVTLASAGLGDPLHPLTVLSPLHGIVAFVEHESWARAMGPAVAGVGAVALVAHALMAVRTGMPIVAVAPSSGPGSRS